MNADRDADDLPHDRPMTAPLTPEAAAAILDVSRETLDRLSAHLDLLSKWQKSINLVGPATLADPWRRHVVDSGQLAPLIPEGARTLADLGSGAGFPGLVLAILRPALAVTLIESDARKAAFLIEAARTVSAANVTVLSTRAESAQAGTFDVITSRALAPLSVLLTLAEGLCTQSTAYLFPKGRRVHDELTAARKGWMMTIEEFPSATDPSAALLRLTKLARR
jgi:16S rRNA (guanine527-N7)-methyltransferase